MQNTFSRNIKFYAALISRVFKFHKYQLTKVLMFKFYKYSY